ncbi:MAG: hypothetical protein PUP93_17790 [Rhizonema sp. NSF051]|nr:hypothetical protein [Rhizonema sp. NSF051]
MLGYRNIANVLAAWKHNYGDSLSTFNFPVRVADAPSGADASSDSTARDLSLKVSS